MTTVELLKPRYEVIADYPRSWYNKGDILLSKIDHAPQLGYIAFSVAEKYTDVFRKLEWWEHRKPEDMPECVKFTSPMWKYKKGDVVKVIDWTRDFKANIFHLKYPVNILYPATEEEYTNYTNNNQP